MMWEIAVVGVLIFIILFSQGIVDTGKFVKDNEKVFKLLKEKDYDFLVAAKYGDTVDPNVLFEKRIKNSMVALLIIVVIFLTMGSFSFVNLLICFILAFLIFKSGYSNLTSYYKKHLHEIDLLLPYYLKSLEILIQHYTVPVALSKSVDQAPPIFKDGLKELIGSINAGDSSIDPYMAFAIRYPVRDSMRMMRLLYRLGLGNQERKQEQLIVFSRTISNLQNKSRETKYKDRLDKMEKKTMTMFTCTGLSIMVLLLFAIMQMMTAA